MAKRAFCVYERCTARCPTPSSASRRASDATAGRRNAAEPRADPNGGFPRLWTARLGGMRSALRSDPRPVLPLLLRAFARAV